MNSEPNCRCCPPLSCDICMPQSISKGYVRIRAERPTKPELICSTKKCNIFGGHDTNPMPEYECRVKRNLVKYENENSLGSPIGLVASNVNFKTEDKASDVVEARYATYLKGFARLHLNTEKSWDPLLIDDIMKEGLKLYTISQQRETNEESPTDIYTPNEQNILREFELSSFTFRVELLPAFELNRPNSSQTGAKGDGLELTLEDFLPAMKSFFRQHKYALLTVGSFYAIIWRTKEAYFVFDICGRRVSDFQADIDKGVAMLICLSYLENIRHLIVNLTGLQASDPLLIREIKVVKVITPNGGIIQQDYGTRVHQYKVINDDYAYLQAGLHLTLNKKDLLRNRSSLPVAVTAIVVSKIDHPATWDMKMLDKIICFGVNFCQTFWAKCGDTDGIDVTEFPTYFAIGQFQITTELVAHKYQGTWRCVPDFKHSQLTQVLKRAFDAGDHKLLLQINHQIYSIWKKHDFIYLLDPYRHRILGKQSESEVYEHMEKSATMRMFRSFEVFMNVLNQILLDSNRSSKFFLHLIKIKNIQNRPKEMEYTPGQVEEPKLDAFDEIMSINEHICFNEAEDLCQKALAEISDYEDDDLKSDVDEIELRTSSSEAEDLLEEEEAAAGEVEEMEGLESSSSGEEGGGHKKKSQNSQGGGKSNKGKKSKGKGHKSGSNKRKKGQGTQDSETGGRKRKKEKHTKHEESSEEDGRDRKKPKKVKNVDIDKTTKNNEDESTKEREFNDTPFEDRNKNKDSKYDTKRSKTDRKFNSKENKEDDDKKEDSESKANKAFKDKGDSREPKAKYKDAGKDNDNIQKKDKDLSEDKDHGKNKDKDMDPNKDKSLIKDRDQNKDTILDKTKDKDINKYNDQVNNKKITKNKDQSKNQDLNEDKNLIRDRDLTKDKDENKNSDKSKDRFLNKDKELIRDKDLSKDKDPDKDKVLNKEKNLDKDIDQSKIKGNVDLNMAKDKTDQDKDRTNFDLSDGNFTKPDSAIKPTPTQPPDSDKNKTGQSKNKDGDVLFKSDKWRESDKENDRVQNYEKTSDLDPTKYNAKDINKTTPDIMKKLAENISKDEKREKDLPKTKESDKIQPYDLKQKTSKIGDKSRSGKDHSPDYNDGTEADDENDDYFKKNQKYCSVPNPNRYPGYFKSPADMAIVGSESGSYASICKLFQAGFKVADRILIMTPWGNFVVFRCAGKFGLGERHYFLFDGCTCNFERFRHLDLSVGTAGLICFKHIHNVIEYIRHLRKSRRKKRDKNLCTADDICKEFSNRSLSLRL